MNIKDMLSAIRLQYPGAKKIEITYGGGGDSFDGFYSYDITEGEGEIDEDTFRNEYNELLHAAIEATGDSFNDDGSQGTIHIDLVNEKVWAEHYFIVTHTEKDNDYDVSMEEEEEEKDI